MHDTAYVIGQKFLELYWSEDFESLLEVGSRNVNGTLKDFCPDGTSYTGVDIEEGPGVDLVLNDPYTYPFDDDSFDLILSSSCFEHDQMFWLTFCEMGRLLKKNGYLYLSAPSNGKYHGYPFDNWRFYPDAGLALEAWAKRKGLPLRLIESFTARRKGDIWNDFVAVFVKTDIEEDLSQPKLSSALSDIMNIRTWKSEELVEFCESPEDMQLIQQLESALAEKEKRIAELEDQLAVRNENFKPQELVAKDIELPLEFNASLYKERHEDLQRMTDEESLQHYLDHGKGEGRICSIVDSRHAFIKFSESCSSVLEIGPFFNPALSKSNTNVKYLDFCSTTELEERAKDIPGADLKAIPTIDYVWGGERYTDLISERFDAVFSSHNIEHQPSLVHHLNEVSSVLKRGGRYFLAIPDKRYCFDHYMPETNLAEILNAYLEKRDRHSARSVLLHRFYTVHNDPVRHWQGDHDEDPFEFYRTSANMPSGIEPSLDEIRNSNGYIDTHAWFFTPDSFRSICVQLKKLGLIQGAVERVYNTVKNSNEFYAVLKF